MINEKFEAFDRVIFAPEGEDFPKICNATVQCDDGGYYLDIIIDYAICGSRHVRANKETEIRIENEI
jgi:hypothetical protein